MIESYVVEESDDEMDAQEEDDDRDLVEFDV